MSVAVARKERPLVGEPTPRIAPPTPARSAVADFQAEADGIGLSLIPAQVTVGRYLYALGPDDRWLYPEVAAIVARQNGKTKTLLPHILRRLRMGRRILHVAQTRALPRRLFSTQLAPLVMRLHPDAVIRHAGGQESIEIPNGGLYLIAAATGGGARGIDAIDDLLVDEVREIDEDFIAAAVPTTFASPNPQTFYLSNAGHDGTDVLNAIRARSGEDPALAYLEWSADPELDAGDHRGWAQANPGLGHFLSLEALDRIYTSSRLSRSMADFETEYLCRWVPSTRERLVSEIAWASCEVGALEEPTRPFLGVSMDPDGRRASAAMAWLRPDGKIALRHLLEGTGNPINVDKLGSELRTEARRLGIVKTGFDPLTDKQLARFFMRTEPIAGPKFANASARFVSALEGQQLAWTDAAQIGTDLSWTTRKPNDEKGSFEAVRADDNRPITALLAAVRAVWLASEPRPDRAVRQAVPTSMGF